MPQTILLHNFKQFIKLNYYDQFIKRQNTEIIVINFNFINQQKAALLPVRVF